MTDTVCPCETDDPNPGPRLASCPWSDPGYNDGAAPPFTASIRWLDSPVSPESMAAGILRVEADMHRSAGQRMMIHHIVASLQCLASMSLNRAPYGRRRRGKAPSRGAIARYLRRASDWSASMTQHLLAAEAYGEVIAGADDMRRAADKIEETR